MKILIVEDDDVSRVKLAAILEGLGECLLADSGPVGVAAFREALAAGAPFDLVTLDIGLPEMDGTEVLYEIRKMERSARAKARRRTKIIMVTAQSDRDSLVTCVQAGCDDYIIKPFDPEVVLKRMERLGFVPAACPLPQAASPGESAGVALDKVAIGREVINRFQRGEISLPSPPHIFTEFTKLVEQGADLRRIADLLKEDVGISFYLISVSNSPVYRGVEDNKNLYHALGRLGLNLTQKYVSVLCNRAAFTACHKGYESYIENLWEHSLACAHAAERITKLKRLAMKNDPFTLGLMHDVGKMVLIQLVSELESRRTLGPNVDRSDILATLDAYHGPIGEAILEQWKFDQEFGRVSRHHDNPEDETSPVVATYVINLANFIAKSLGFGYDERLEVDLPATPGARALHVTGEQIDEIKGGVAKLMHDTKIALP